MTLWTAISWALLLLAIGVAAWAVLSDPARGRLRCPGGWKRLLWVIPWRRGCWYDMAGVAGAADGSTGDSRFPVTCPECGRACARLADLQRTRVRYRALLLTVPMLLGAHVASVMPRVERHGWWSAAPTWALVMTVPLEEFARGALGCPISWNQMPDQTRELMYPKWHRPVSAWESQVLKWRVDAAVGRVSWEFPGRTVATVAIDRYSGAEWWGWEGRALTWQERQMMGGDAVAQAMGLVFDDGRGSGDADPGEVGAATGVPSGASSGASSGPTSEASAATARDARGASAPARRGGRMPVALDPDLERTVGVSGLLVYGAAQEKVEAFARAIERLEGLRLSPGECRVLGEHAGQSLIAVDISAISPCQYVPVRASESALGAPVPGAVGGPRWDPVPQELARALRRVNPEGRFERAEGADGGPRLQAGASRDRTASPMGTPRSGVLAGVVSRADVQVIGSTVREVARAWHEAGYVGPMLPSPSPGLLVRVFNLAVLAGADGEPSEGATRTTPGIIERACDAITRAMRPEGTSILGTIGEAMPIRHVVVVVGTPEQQAQAEQAIAELIRGATGR